MIKFLTLINRLLEGFCWLYLPIILLYWALTLITIAAIEPLKNIVGIIVQPPVRAIDEYFNFQFMLGGTEVDYTPIALAGVVTICAICSVLTTQILDFISIKINDVKMEILRKTEIKNQQKEKEAYLQELERNKTIYMLLKLEKVQKHESYLVQQEEDIFSKGMIESYETSIKNMAKNFAGVEYKNFENKNGAVCFVFNDAKKFIKYINIFTNKIPEINQGTADLNTIFSYIMACSCSYDVATAETDLIITERILNLVGKNEIYLTSLLKEKLENVETDLNLKFESKGLYLFDKKDIEVYKMQIKQDE